MGQTANERYILPIEDFLRSGSHNAWLRYGPMEVFVRRGVHCVGGRIVQAFDIANINTPVDERGKGLFKRLVQDVERLLEDDDLRKDIEGIYVENVYEQSFRDGLVRMGFEQVSRTDDGLNVPSFFSPLPMPFGRFSYAG